MIDHYQPFLFPFFGFHALSMSPFVKRYYYWSWEDALWDLLRGKRVEKGSVVLVPDFYCRDVVDNIRMHGYTVIFYKLNQHFQVKKQTLITSIRRHHPSVVIIFHACGITSEVMKNPTWMKKIPSTTLIIEDCVQQLINPSLVRPLNDNHFLIDSLRKVSPLYGSFLYGTKKGLEFHQGKKLWSFYTLYSLLLYGLFRFLLMSAHLFSQPKLASFAHEKILKTHDDIIGSSVKPHRGIPFFGWLAQWIYVDKIERLKSEQVKMYEHVCQALWGARSPFYRIKIKRSDFQSLHVYPIGLRKKATPEFIAYLHENKIIVWPKFPDSPWANKQDVLFLPLGFHVQKQDIKMIAKKLKQWKVGLKEWKEKAIQTVQSPHLLMRAAALFVSE